MRGRSGRVAALATLAFALGAAGGGGPVAGVETAGAATLQTTSSNWSGYAVRRTGVTFKRVSGTWTVPAVDCSNVSRASYSANWVGLGGYTSTSQALEQLGTESDCTASGKATYTAWFEIVPAAATTAKLTIKAGDVVAASATVNGHLVTLTIKNTTRGTKATRTVRAATVDVSSAEWIVEAPSLCSGSTTSDAGCAQTSLANFGSTTFSAARAVTTAGRTGTIADSAWNAVAITLRATTSRQGPGGFGPGGGGDGGGRGHQELASSSSSGAVPAALSATGDAFTVDYGDTTSSAS
jgi:hypothetical protein